MWVDRNDEGKIAAVYQSPQREGQETVAWDDPEGLAFLTRTTASVTRKVRLKADLEQAKTVADLKAILEQVL